MYNTEQEHRERERERERERVDWKGGTLDSGFGGEDDGGGGINGLSSAVADVCHDGRGGGGGKGGYAVTGCGISSEMESKEEKVLLMAWHGMEGMNEGVVLCYMCVGCCDYGND